MVSVVKILLWMLGESVKRVGVGGHDAWLFGNQPR